MMRHICRPCVSGLVTGSIHGSLSGMRSYLSLMMMVPVLAVAAEPSAKPGPATPPAAAAGKTPAPVVSPELKAAINGLKLPGIQIDPTEWCVDVDSSICLRKGLLELIACTKDTKEHESLVVVEAKPSHIHTALLLLHAKPGSPAMQKMREEGDEDGPRFIHFPPSGGEVDVFLVTKGADGKSTERPISDFIARTNRNDSSGTGAAGEASGEPDGFPTHTFLFAGSILAGNEGEPRTYYCDHSGNVISIATFGDELLCLPDVHASDNGSLIWEAKSATLPEPGTKVTLRLRPKIKPPTTVPNEAGKPKDTAKPKDK